MKKILLLIIYVILTINIVNARAVQNITSKKPLKKIFITKQNFNIGNTVITVHKKYTLPTCVSEENYMNFINVHQNEVTSLKAGLKMINKYGGNLVYLKHGHGRARNIKFKLNNKDYEIDPNRIFTDNGIKENLRYYGIKESLRYDSNSDDNNAFIEVKEFSKKLLPLIGIHEEEPEMKQEFANLIALHNNFNKGYSFNSYLPDGELSHEALGTHQSLSKAKSFWWLRKNSGAGEFFFTTSPEVFNALKNNQYFNVVLQNNKYVTQDMNDDGSLSVYAAKQGITNYINIEAKHGHFKQQIKMLETIKDYFQI